MESLRPYLEELIKASKPLLEELQKRSDVLRLQINDACTDYEPWQLIAISAIATLISIKLARTLNSATTVETTYWKAIKSNLFKIVIKLPFVSGFANKEINKTVTQIMAELYKPFKKETFTTKLPRDGISPAQIIAEIKRLGTLTEVEWEKGRVSGGIYADHTNGAFKTMMADVYGLTAYTNPLHPDVFPGVRKMEAEVVRMTCTLFRGDEDTCGCMTTGGTESIVMAVKAWRDYGRSERGITEPEMIVPVTVHAGFDKAAQYLGVKIIHIPVDEKTQMVNVRKMRSAISSRTILLVGSAPNFPNGIIDPIVEIAKLGQRYRIPVHVDSCLGGFLVPFMREAGYSIPDVDFSVPGVLSISADTHKYGYAPKGSSVVMYRNEKYRQYQYSVTTDWPGGVYVTQTISGSRAGGNIATCWASMRYHGHAGYLESVKKIMKTTQILKKGLAKIEGIFIYGDPQMSVIAIGSNEFAALQMAEQLSKKGWNLNTLQFPSGFHICVTLMHTLPGVAEQLLEDCRVVAAELLEAGPNAKLSGQAAVYGMAQALPDRSLIANFAKHYLDAYYCTKWDHFENGNQSK